MRVAFFGTSTFAVPVLQALVTAHDVVAVVTQPDRPAGRGKTLMPTPVKVEAQKHGLAVAEPLRIWGEFEAWLAGLEADAFVVVSYGRILPASLLEIPRFGAFNVHPSDLPLYRGATPMTATIKDGHTDSAVCVIAMDQGLDTGDIVARRAVTIAADETGGLLHDRLAPIGAELVLETLAAAANGTLTRQAQAGLRSPEEIAATMTKPLRTPDLLVDWNWKARNIVNHVRAYAPQPAARADLAGERVKLLEVALDEAERPSLGTPGEIIAVDGDDAFVRCGHGHVAVRRVIPPSRGAQSGGAFARGRRHAGSSS